MKIFHFIFLFAIILIACKPNSSGIKTPEMPATADVAAYEDTIMKIHDAVMPKMTDLNRLETTLRNIRMEAGKSEMGSAAIPQGIDDMIASVKAAQNQMLDWMEYYSAMRSKLEPDKLMEFMKSEIAKITLVSKKINDTIDKAKAWLEAHPQ